MNRGLPIGLLGDFDGHAGPMRRRTLIGKTAVAAAQPQGREARAQDLDLHEEKGVFRFAKIGGGGSRRLGAAFRAGAPLFRQRRRPHRKRLAQNVRRSA